MSRFSYPPLPATYTEDGDTVHWARMVTLQPGAFDEALFISLEDACLSTDSPPEYEALSYVWGSPATSTTTSLPGVMVINASPNPSSSSSSIAMNLPQSNNNHAFQFLPTTPNLESTLRHLRYPNKTRHLWVDAICVNQTDDDEKNVQVSQMGDVYRRAATVVVWLGPEADDSTFALSTLDRLGSQVEHANLHPTPRLRWKTPQNTPHHVPSTRREVSSIMSLIERPWFPRVWVLLQELNLASLAADRLRGVHHFLEHLPQKQSWRCAAT
ncbi:uncharacterized protein MKZ38_008490 [Zalerion maritima]|uniref:Heterokaryon incompatibility domain-containing protein n=1 Tax=Zalerion maritima TaxID=339359 RepID=A0AAD5RU97_9PEZI|nr:uncharacterized protein MKZ38_008490 [Zalerion maritima]